MKNNNSGFSLAELLVAIGIGGIVSTAIASLIVISLRMYNNESVNVGMQYELQSSLNTFIDAAQGTQGLVLKNDTSSWGDPYTSYIVLGKYQKSGTPTAVTYDFYGDVFYALEDSSSTDKFNIYMYHVPSSSPMTGLTSVDGFVNAIVTAADNADKKYLLSKDVRRFLIECKSDCLDATHSEYINPLSLDIHLTFGKEAVEIGGGKDIIRNVDDTARIRNRVKVPIVVDGVSYNMKKE